MALSQRSASRFFAAFYRWNRCTERTRYTTTIIQTFHDRATCPVLTAKRQYHRSHSWRQQVTTGADAGHEVSEKREPLSKRISREIFRMAPSSVAVITVASEDQGSGNPLPMGVAVSSLTSVTLDPPTISFNIKQPSQTLDAIHAAGGKFFVHFLEANAKGAQIVDLFSRGNHADAYKMRTDNLKIAMPRKLEGRYSFPPLILDDAVMAWMNCTVTHELTVADHVIIAARVDSGQHKWKMQPLLAYADGKYRQVADHLNPDSSSEMVESSNTEVLSGDNHMGSGRSAWDISLSPDIQDRQQYVNHFKSIIRRNFTSIIRQCPVGLELTRVKDNLRKLMRYKPSLVGIEWQAFAHDCVRDAGQPDGPATYNPSLSRYYGRLSALERQALITEVVEAVRADPDLQSLAYPDFLRHFGVNFGVIGLLPSDFMRPLREAGLDKSQNLSETDLRDVLRTRIHCSLPIAEQIEGLLRNHISALSFVQANKCIKKRGFGLKVLGETMTQILHGYFSRSGPRLIAECHPIRFAEEYIDIKGDLTDEEVRVVLARIIRSLWAEGIRVFKKRLRMDPYEILYLNGIHPLVTGLNIELLFAKLLHIDYSALFYVELKLFETNLMVEPYFKMFIENTSLRRSIQRFVDHPPANASKWTKEDKLAAMGIHWDSKTTVLRKGRTGTEEVFVPVMDIEEIDALFDGVDAEPQGEQKVEEKPEDKPEDKLEAKTKGWPEAQVGDAHETEPDQDKDEGRFATSDANVHAWLDDNDSSAPVTHDNGEVEDYIEDEVEANPRSMSGDAVENKPGQIVGEKSEHKPEDITEEMTEYENDDWFYSSISQMRPARKEQSEPTNWLTFSLLKRKKRR